MEEINWFSLVTVPLFMAAIGWVTNWTGVWMLFNPLEFRGWRIPGLLAIVNFLPRKVQQVPGIMSGGVGWQGIIPSRAAKMGSIAVDKGIAKLGSPAEFYEQLEPEKIAQHILATARDDMRQLVEQIMEREHPQLWHDTPPAMREAVHDRVQQRLPDIVRTITDEIGNNIDQLLDVKLMVIRHMEAQPELCNRIFQEIGRKELRFIIHFGFAMGLVLGIPVAILTEVIFHFWWLLPICGVIVGYVTNLVGIWMIFEPARPRSLLGVKLQGLFMRRQNEAADIYARIIAEEVVTLSNIGDQLLNGPAADRTRAMIEAAIRPRGGQRGGTGALGGARGHGQARLRRGPRVGRRGGRRLHHDPHGRSGVQPPAGRPRELADRRAHAPRWSPRTSPSCCARP